MVSVEYGEAIAEALDILKHTKKEDVDKISPKFMEFLNANASKTYKPELDHTKNIKDMQLKLKTKAILAIIYKKFWCDSEKQEQFNRALKENEIKREKELREKYNSDNLFKDKSNMAEIVIEPQEEKNTRLIEVKEQKWYQKIIARILKIFKRKQ